MCWTLDKLGPTARYVEDTLIVLRAISGPDQGDPASVESHLDFDVEAPIAGLRVDYVKRWMDEPPATQVDRKALDAVRKLGMETREVTLPDWPYVSLNTILFAEAAAPFEELTLTRGVLELRSVLGRHTEPVASEFENVTEELQCLARAAPPPRRTRSR